MCQMCVSKKFSKMRRVGFFVFLFCLSVSSKVVYGETIRLQNGQDTAMLSTKWGTVHRFFCFLFAESIKFLRHCPRSERVAPNGTAFWCMGILCYVSPEPLLNKDMKMILHSNAHQRSFSRNWSWIAIWSWDFHSSAHISENRMLPVVAFCQPVVVSFALFNKSCQYFFVTIPK
jgi:hypothetical protein